MFRKVSQPGLHCGFQNNEGIKRNFSSSKVTTVEVQSTEVSICKVLKNPTAFFNAERKHLEK